MYRKWEKHLEQKDASVTASYMHVLYNITLDVVFGPLGETQMVKMIFAIRVGKTN